ncbi:MAG: response regulator [Campylobacterota bacterium]|nr:response regulator [Campylobacterota bacterium]
MSDIKLLKEEAKDFTLLYAEDNESLRSQAGVLLKKFFPKVYLAQDGEDALTQFKKYCPSIVITDIKMPKRDGISLVKHIKSICSETIIR